MCQVNIFKRIKILRGKDKNSKLALGVILLLENSLVAYHVVIQSRITSLYIGVPHGPMITLSVSSAPTVSFLSAPYHKPFSSL